MKALITGASSGIGKEMAKYLLNYNYELFLVAKDKDQLDKIFKDYKQVKTYGYDLTKEKEFLNK